MKEEKDILKEITSAKNEEELENLYKYYLWKKWTINQEFKKMSELSPEERKEKGKKMWELKSNIEKVFKEKKEKFLQEKINKSLNEEIVDITTPWIKLPKWNYSLLASTRREIEDIFKTMGFKIRYWEDLVNKYQNFNSLNIPSSHPATEMHDTIYTKEIDSNWENMLLRTHTSAMQNKFIKEYWVPLKLIIPGKVYRYENTDASHDTYFDQLEWVIIDKDISIANFKSTMEKFFTAIFKTQIEIRMRPAYFPFVEPGFEIDASCPICKKSWCSLCQKTWWIELLWAGMIHPNVLKNADVDPDEYRWFAFGIWTTRLIAIKHWIKDIRLFTNWDLKFAKSS